MAKLRKVKTEVSVDSDLTPLIDCIFLLLIFLVCTTEITKTANDQLLVLPYAEKAVPDENPKERIVINVYPDEKTIHAGDKDAPAKAVCTILAKGYDWAGLTKYLEARAKTAEKTPGTAGTMGETVEMPVKIRGHRTAPFRLIQFTIVYCIDNRYWRISFGTFNPDDFVAPSSFTVNGPKDWLDKRTAPPNGGKGEVWFPPYLQRVMSPSKLRTGK